MSDYVGHFSLSGDLKIEEITDQLKMQPSQVFLKGDTLEGASAAATVSSWDLHCPPDCESMQEQIKFLLGILWPKADVLKPLAAQFNAELNICNCGEEGASVFSLDHDALQQLAALNLKLNCFYLCCEDSNAN